MRGGAVGGVGLEELADKVLGVLADFLPVPFVEDDSAVAALLDEVRETLAAERRVSTQKRVGDDSKRPHVNSLSMALLQHHLGRGVSERASHGVQHGVLRVKHLSNSEVGQHERRVPVGGEVEKVLGLQICFAQLSSHCIAETIWIDVPRWTMLLSWR